jgi:3-oxoacyl-[acyl-carrier protein] reductase
MKIDFTNKKVLVTGGSKGIGKKLVDDFTSLGAEVTYTSRTDMNDSRNIIVDFNNEDDMTRFEDYLEHSSFDVLINNAGTNKIGSVLEYSLEDYERIIKLNLTSCFRVMKSVMKNMKNNGYGRVVNITSISSEISMPLRSAYCSSKFGLNGLSKVCAVEMARYGVLVNSVGPGVTETELTVGVLGREKMDEISKSVPIQRLASVQDISNVVLFMASDLNTYMVGQNVIVDGGYTCI